MNSLADIVLTKLDAIVAVMDELIGASTIDHDPRKMERLAAKGIIVALPDSTWGPLNDRQRLLQRRVLELWKPWLEQVRLLFSADTKSWQKEIAEAAASVRKWMERDDRDFSLPPTINEAHAVLRAHVAPIQAALRSLTASTSPVLVVPDTNVLLRSQDVAKYADVLGTDAYTVVLVAGVLGELDDHKVNHKNEAVRERARKFSNRIKGWRNQGDLATGVRVEGQVFVHVEGREPDLTKTLSWLDKDVNDDRIIASVLELQRRDPAARVVLLTGDSIMLAKADAASVPTADTPDPDP